MTAVSHAFETSSAIAQSDRAVHADWDPASRTWRAPRCVGPARGAGAGSRLVVGMVACLVSRGLVMLRGNPGPPRSRRCQTLAAVMLTGALPEARVRTDRMDAAQTGASGRRWG